MKPCAFLCLESGSGSGSDSEQERPRSASNASGSGSDSEREQNDEEEEEGQEEGKPSINKVCLTELPPRRKSIILSLDFTLYSVYVRNY